MSMLLIIAAGVLINVDARQKQQIQTPHFLRQ